MNSEKIKEIIDKIPVGLLMILYLGYLGFDYYSFNVDPESLINVKKREIGRAKDTGAKLELKLKEANQFVKSLEVKKVELRKLAVELQGMKETLVEKSDVPAFMKMIITEAKRIGVSVVSLRPGGTVDKEYYTETSFLMTFRGVFVQVAGFLDRLSNVSEIVRVENIALKPIVSGKSRFVMLEGSVDIKTYKYRGSSADNLGKLDPLTSLDSKPALPTKGDVGVKAKGGP